MFFSAFGGVCWNAYIWRKSQITTVETRAATLSAMAGSTNDGLANAVVWARVVARQFACVHARSCCCFGEGMRVRSTRALVYLHRSGVGVYCRSSILFEIIAAKSRTFACVLLSASLLD